MVPSLDCPDLYERFDPARMRDHLPQMAAQCREAVAATRSLSLPSRYRHTTSVVVAGMGTSGLAGEMASDLLHYLGVPCPLTVWRDYGLPAWAGEKTLVVACSYSGNTAETLSAYQSGTECGAGVVPITNGGELARRAGACVVAPVAIPSRWGGRHSLAGALAALLGVLQAAGHAPDLNGQIDEAASLIDQQSLRFGLATPEAENPAKALARRLWGRVPVVYGAGLLTSAARRWQYDINENAKAWAVTATWPELQHNAVSGYCHPSTLSRNAYALILLSSHLPSALSQRVPVTEELLRSAGVAGEKVEADGELVGARGLGPLAHQLGMVYLGSWVSYYLALLYGVDPVANEALDIVRRSVASLPHKPSDPP
ncbi:MAG: hypothetical protein EXR47_02830 [Dehalococcoidia bacterium]|nr:hypothetical protein [Dehalococcoidia bacterium]